MLTRSRRLLVIPALIIVLLEFGAVLYALPTQQNNNTGIGFASIYVYKNGRLVYYDPDDPPTNNWAYTVASLLLPEVNPFTIVDIGGSTHSHLYTTSYFSGNVQVPSKSQIWLINNSNVQFYSSMNKIDSNYYIPLGIDTDNYVVDVSTHTIYASVSYTYLDSTTSNITIYGIAFATGFFNSYGSTETSYALMFVDIFDTAITLNYNDTITVSYKFNMPFT